MSTQTFASTEIEAVWNTIESGLDALVRLTSGLAAERLNWRPEASADSEATNSLYVLAWHTLGAAEEALLFTLCGEAGSRDRDSEFRASESTSAAIEERWASLRERIPIALAKQDGSVLDAQFVHPRRGPETGRQLVLGVAQHAGVHLGHAQLTHDLLPPAE